MIRRSNRFSQLMSGVTFFSLGLSIGYLYNLQNLYTSPPRENVCFPTSNTPIYKGLNLILPSVRNLDDLNHQKQVLSNNFLGKQTERFKTSCDPLDDPEDDLIKFYGRDVIMMGRGYEGSGTRTRRFLKSLQDGKTVKVGVVGGSVSFGHGMYKHGPGTIYSERVLDWIKATYPNNPSSNHELFNGAVPGSSVVS
ncbi:uncharacterized protein MELLADRAFT_104472 [Melampsora larici-populina 98AG31]|uniref:Uncharacterized protein n=1 Tax=Melampsora larici-populina (strain 98AG31 / pathotype 3-4-7) TaxID=747676 RepID=F4RET9_MELLP|nr:uncharacterized protein MELLADRAFT_104472 [Melampsora larici-populina 98AG31]EGG09161.1 hypothetical protein MELLADRAFT_104472 [Melampsora larici-populina 98AG31]